MLADKDVIATIAVKDIKVASRFYEGTLGLKRVHAEGPSAIAYASGKSTVLVYESQYARTNRATAATWMAGEDVAGIVQALKANGATFERYDFPGVTHEGDVHVMGDMSNAWLKDPDGNILAIVGQRAGRSTP